MPKTTMPSGRVFNTSDMELMKAAATTGFIKWFAEEKTLASGKKSHVYVQGRDDTTHNPYFLTMACRKILRDTHQMMVTAPDLRKPRFIGIPHVAHGFTPALAVIDYHSNITSRGACFAIMRSATKSYGGKPGRWVEGEVDVSTFRDILFDNVVTDSGSKVEAAEHLVADGFELKEIDCMVFVDRQQGGLQAMGGIGFRSVHANYFLLDMVHAFGQLECWSGDAVEQVRREIEANQIAV